MKTTSFDEERAGPPRSYFVVGPEGFPSWPEPVQGIEAALREKAAFIERFRVQGHYAPVGRRIPFEDLADEVSIEPRDHDSAEVG